MMSDTSQNSKSTNASSAKTSASASSDEFADLEISENFQPIKTRTKTASTDYEVAMTGPASFMSPPPKKIDFDAEDDQATVEQVAGIEIVNEDSKPARSKMPLVAAVVLTTAAAAFLAGQNWQSASAVASAAANTAPSYASASFEDRIPTVNTAINTANLSPITLATPQPDATPTVSADTSTTVATLSAPVTEPTEQAADRDLTSIRIKPFEQPAPRKAEFVPLQAQSKVQPVVQTGLSRTDCAARYKTVSRSGSINFQPSSATLLESSRPMLQFFASVYELCSEFEIIVSGHTDASGSAAFNEALSEKRAMSVAEYLVSIGVPAEKLRVVGYGESMPIATNNTALRRSRNRRIEFMIGDG